jgi:glycosyltransferase involved in cell wall biosynthesis
MRIGIDARELFGRPTGVGRYLGELLKRWTPDRTPGDARFILYAPDAAATGGSALPGGLEAGRGEIRHLRGTPGTWWEQTHLRSALAHDALDVFFAPGYTAPLLTRVPRVVTVHDVSFVAHPEWFTRREGSRRRWMTALSARGARTILTVSEFSREEIVRLLGVGRERIRVIRQGATLRVAADPLRGRREPLVLYVGSIFNRRHVSDLVAAFALVHAARPDARLSIVGDNRTYPPEDPLEVARLLGVAEAIAIESYVPDERLADLYGRASVFAFLSEYEGFGLTPLDALAAGVPVVLLDTAQAREIFGDTAVYVGSRDVGEVAAAIRRLMEDDGLRQRILDGVPDLLRRYSWDRAAAETFEALAEAASPRRSGRIP